MEALALHAVPSRCYWIRPAVLLEPTQTTHRAVRFPSDPQNLRCQSPIIGPARLDDSPSSSSSAQRAGKHAAQTSVQLDGGDAESGVDDATVHGTRT